MAGGADFASREAKDSEMAHTEDAEGIRGYGKRISGAVFDEVMVLRRSRTQFSFEHM
jgi:hypothetical protein